jgi:hypothetical protein
MKLSLVLLRRKSKGGFIEELHLSKVLKERGGKAFQTQSAQAQKLMFGLARVKRVVWEVGGILPYILDIDT